MSVETLIPEISPEYVPITTSDDVMMMSLPPCCRGGGCANMTGSMSLSSTIGTHFHENSLVVQAADSIGLSKPAQRALDHRFAVEYGKNDGRAVFAILIAKLAKEPKARRSMDVAAINTEYGESA